MQGRTVYLRTGSGNLQKTVNGKTQYAQLNEALDKTSGSGIIEKTTVNAIGKPVEIVERTEIKGKPVR